MFYKICTNGKQQQKYFYSNIKLINKLRDLWASFNIILKALIVLNVIIILDMILGLDIYLLEPYIVYCMKLPNGFFKKTLMDGSEIYFYGDIYNINMPQFKQFVKFTHKIILFTDEISYGIHNYKPIKGDLKNQILDRTSPFAHSHLNILHNSLINSDYYYNFQLTSGHGSKPINKFSILTDNNIINSGLSQDASNHFYILEKSYVDKITNKKLSNDQIQNYLNNEKSKKNIKDHLFNNFSKNKITKK